MRRGAVRSPMAASRVDKWLSALARIVSACPLLALPLVMLAMGLGMLLAVGAAVLAVAFPLALLLGWL